MKFSLGVRLFFAVLFSMITVSVLLLLLMRENVAASFADYTQRIELDRLQEISDSIENYYAQHDGWTFLPSTPEKKQDWIKEELLRLYLQRLADKTKAEEVKIEAPTPAAPVDLSPSAHASIPTISDRESPLAKLSLPTAPPVPPLPPLPPPPPPLEPDEIAMNDAPDVAHFFRRISLLDKNEHYLAGQATPRPDKLRPLHYKGTVIAYLGLQKSTLPSDAMSKDFIAEQADIILLSIAASVFFSAVVASLLALHFRRPILQLANGAKQLAEENFDVRLPDQRSDELGELARSFNLVAIKLGKAEQHRRQWVADTSHELRTPISVMRAQLEAIQDGIRSATPENIALMLRQVLSLNKLIDELYLLARSDLGELPYHFQNINLRDLVLEEAANFSEKFKKAQLTLDLQIGDDSVWLNADPDRLRQVLINLLENSIRYTHAGGLVRLRIKVGDAVQSKGKTYENSVHIFIEDSAPGLTQSELAHLGERFYRAEASRNRDQGGAGLGLAMCKKIIQAHHGQLSFTYSDLGGLAVNIQLPTTQL